MALAALIVSILALLLSGFVYYRTDRRDRERRHDELTPDLTLTCENDLDVPLLRLRNNGPVPYDHVEATLVPPTNSRSQRFVALRSNLTSAAPTVSTQADIGPLGLGASAVIGLQEGSGDDEATVTVRLLCRCMKGRDGWKRLVECDVPGVPRIHVL